MMFIRFMVLLCWLPVMYVDSAIVRSIFLKIVQWNGALFIKLTQMYASVYDTRLDDVFDNINEHTMVDTERIYSEDFGESIHETYDVKTIPMASGSIGQVYEAMDKRTGDTVAIKVRHPGVFETSMRQIVYFKWILRILCRTMSVVDVNTALETYMAQLNFAKEAENMRRFNDNFAGVSFVKFPKPLKVSENIIVMTHHAGLQKRDIVCDDYTYSKAVLMLFAATRMMFLEHGFLHCDIHQGNWAYCKTEKKIIVYDTGCAIDSDVELCTELLRKVFHKNINGALIVFMERMLSKDIERDRIEEWLNKNGTHIDEMSKKSDGRTILRIFIKCAHDLRSSIKKEMLFFLLSNVALDKVFDDNGCTGVSHDDSMFTLKSELGLIRGTGAIRYESFIRECLKNDTPRIIDAMTVESFYDLKNN